MVGRTLVFEKIISRMVFVLARAAWWILAVAPAAPTVAAFAGKPVCKPFSRGTYNPHTFAHVSM